MDTGASSSTAGVYHRDNGAGGRDHSRVPIGGARTVGARGSPPPTRASVVAPSRVVILSSARPLRGGITWNDTKSQQPVIPKSERSER